MSYLFGTLSNPPTIKECYNWDIWLDKIYNNSLDKLEIINIRKIYKILVIEYPIIKEVWGIVLYYIFENKYLIPFTKE